MTAFITTRHVALAFGARVRKGAKVTLLASDVPLVAPTDETYCSLSSKVQIILMFVLVLSLG